MNAGNRSSVTEFILLGFPSSREMQIVYFMVFLLIYILTIAINSLIIIIVRVDAKLHRPMYFFLSNFAFLEICYTTTTVPKMLSGFLIEKNVISYSCCIVQLCFFFTFGPTEFFLLAVMAYDRYVAICYPLRYGIIMNSRLCKQLAVGSWASGFLTSWTLTVPITQLSLCRLNLINHFFCDFLPILKLACSDTTASEAAFFSLAWIVVLCSLLINSVSYGYIILTIIHIPSTTGRRKAFSTCASHLTVVVIFYGTVIFVIMGPTAKYSFDADKIVSLFYSVITPLLNPLIYSLRNRDVIMALNNAWSKIR
ncbi:olfactory receptor 6F1-like [Rhinatrema bivittatum]|uniref:olfactory receptor 6F1-like n=1 Tax=Rhinatrema bivittatum TaxID=194408 RepID=UPI001127991E|nr:olfactory receptor 6F1-like [Rhinatrema bivittatum]